MAMHVKAGVRPGGPCDWWATLRARRIIIIIDQMRER
jgi:hypothetical protein